MTDSNWPPPPPARPPRSERLFEFVRARDDVLMTCEICYHGETYGWEAVFYEGGELSHSRGGFALHEQAVQWADEERRVLEAAR